MKFLPLLFVVVLFACGQSDEQWGKYINTQRIIKRDEKARDRLRSKVEFKRYGYTEGVDSIYVQNKVDSIVSAIQQKPHNYFHTKHDSLNVIYGHVFSPSATHVLINLAYKDYNHIFIFNAEAKGYTRVFYTKEWFMNYRGDSIADINGDGYKDYLLSTEATNHTWHVRADWCVNLFNPKNNGFAYVDCYLNPVFSPKEKLVRGTTYGGPGDVELYKIKWAGIVPDTVEIIYRIKGSNKQFIRTTKHPWFDREKGTIINAIPAEYKSLPEYDYFMAAPVY